MIRSFLVTSYQFIRFHRLNESEFMIRTRTNRRICGTNRSFERRLVIGWFRRIQISNRNERKDRTTRIDRDLILLTRPFLFVRSRSTHLCGRGLRQSTVNYISTFITSVKHRFIFTTYYYVQYDIPFLPEKFNR